MTGALDDGTTGLDAVKQCGGVAIVQEPGEAVAPGMPQSALRSMEVDHCVTLGKMPALLRRLTGEEIAGRDDLECAEHLKILNNKHVMNNQEMQENFGPASSLICPECNGPIWELKDGKHTHYRCLVGHAFSPESFLVEEGAAIERALWTAVKTLQERASLLRSLSERSQEIGQSISAQNLRQKGDESEQHAEVIHNMLKHFEEQTDRAGRARRSGNGSPRSRRTRGAA